MPLILEHRRVGHLYEGSIQLDDGQCWIFSDASYESMLRQLSDVMNEYDTESVVFKRTDKEGLNLVELDAFTTKLIRNNPVQAAKQMSPAPRVVHIKSKVKVGDELHVEAVVQETASVDSIKVTLNSGHDVLADAFGDLIYMRLKDNIIEFPFDGRWKEFTTYRPANVDQEALHIPEYRYASTKVMTWISPWRVSAEWAVIPASTLLEVGKVQKIDRYFLPRAWNTSGPWISHADLKLRYEEYQKEKEATCSKDEAKA